MALTKSFVRLFVLLGMSLLASAGSAAAPDRPNILLVVVDDLRFDDFGAAGHPFARTPHIDRLAREGAQFRDMFAVTPLCSPSRANIVTGLYARHDGILDNTDRSARSHVRQPLIGSASSSDCAAGWKVSWTHCGRDHTARRLPAGRFRRGTCPAGARVGGVVRKTPLPRAPSLSRRSCFGTGPIA